MSEILRITNLQILEKIDKNGNIYFLLFDNDQKSGKNLYVAFSSCEVSYRDWQIMLEDCRNVNEIEIEWEKAERGNRVLKITDIVTYQNRE